MDGNKEGVTSKEPIDPPGQAGEIPPADSSVTNLATARWAGSAEAGQVPTLAFVADLAEASGPVDSQLWKEQGYELIRPLGRGGMGLVLLARQLNLRRLVALKVILSGALATDDDRHRFKQEAEVLARLNHPHIVQIFDVGEVRGQPYCSLEYVEGGTLRRKINGTPQPPKECTSLVAVLARAMHAAHEAGIIHRDIKPDNVLLTGGGTPKIGDFGLAKATDCDFQTMTQGLVGTPSYMAPEQAAGDNRRLGPPCDIYALGALLYELLTGRPPFKGETTLETLHQVQEEEPLAPRKIRPKIPRDLETICLKCLEKEPERRYATALALAEDLERLGRGEPILARRVGPAGRSLRWARRKPAAAGLAAAGFLALVSAAAAWVWYPRHIERLRGEALIESLARADFAEVPRISGELAASHRWSLDELGRRLSDSRSEKERMNLALALARESAAGKLSEACLDVLLWGAKTLDIRDLEVLRAALMEHSLQASPRLWEQLDRETGSQERARIAVVLAKLEPEGPNWAPRAAALTGDLLELDLLSLGAFAEALGPAGPWFVEPLADRFRHGDDPEGRRLLIAQMLADYSANRPTVLASAIAWAEPGEFGTLIKPLKRAPSAARQPLQGALAGGTSAAPAASAASAGGSSGIDDAVKRRIEAAQGLAVEASCFYQRMRADELPVFFQELRASGMRPVRCRPYVEGGTVWAAGVCGKDEGEWLAMIDEPADKIRAMNRDVRARGFVAVELAAYQHPEQAGAEGVRYSAVWVKPAEKTSMGLFVASPEAAHPDSEFLYRERFSMVGAGMVVDSPEPLYHSAWLQSNPWRIPSWTWQAAEADYRTLVSLGDRQLDCWISRGEKGEALFGGAWDDTPRRRTATLFNLALPTHLERGRELAGDGYRLTSIAVLGAKGAQAAVAASVWERESPGSAVSASGERRQSAAGMGLAALGFAEDVMAAIDSTSNPGLRARIIHDFRRYGLPPGPLFAEWRKTSDASRRRALTLALGEYAPDAFEASDREAVAEETAAVMRSTPDAGLRATAQWALTRWGKAAVVKSDQFESAGRSRAEGHSWWVNSLGQTMVAIEGPVTVEVGSPADEDGRFPIELRERVRIPRSFAIGATEVTLAQFDEFLAANPTVDHPPPQLERPNPTGPATSVHWLDALRFCRWLGEKEGIPPEEQSLPEMDQIVPGFRMTAEALERTGYRLPTETEWEFACRAGTRCSRYCGDDPALLPHYAWFDENSSYSASAVAQLKPNDLGLFDTLGNVWEWCFDGMRLREGSRLPVIDDLPAAGATVDESVRVLKGGGCGYSPVAVRAATRNRNDPNLRGAQIGFRIARTLPPAGNGLVQSLPGEGGGATSR
jgi:formylglycine-generating enzyme required for sulfatase activity